MDTQQLRVSIVENLVDVTRSMVDTPFDFNHPSIFRGKQREYDICFKLYEIAKDEGMWTGEIRSMPISQDLRERLELIKFRLNLIGRAFTERAAGN